MLKQRVITAFAMLFVFLGALFGLPLSWFTLAVGALFLIGAWEWADLSGINQVVNRIAYVAATGVLAALAGWYTDWARDQYALVTLLTITAGWWILSFALVKRFPTSIHMWGNRTSRMFMGGFVLIPAWLACIYLRSQLNGAWLILMIVFVIAAADIGAYFTGKAIGKRKLAPNVSPGKSWEGVFGGLLFSLLIGLGFNAFFGADQWGVLVAILIPTALVSVLGDLLESMVKRHRGVKDSSQLLPGHGGVLDRVDGLVAAAPVFSLFLILTSYQL